MTASQNIQTLERCKAAWFLPALMMLASPEFASAQDYSIATNAGSVTITRYGGPGGAVNVPAMIDGLPVTSIGEAAFAFNYGVTSVTIPNSVTNIGQLAFISCTGLTNLFISAGVVNLGELFVKNCNALQAISADTNNPVFSAANGVLFDKLQTALVQYPPGRAGGAYAVPGTVRTIGSGAFFDCPTLTNVSLPAGLLDIEDSAFSGCANLTGILIPNSVTNVGTGAFSGCTGLGQAVLPNSIVSLGAQAFLQCSGLTNVVMGNGVNGVGTSAFSGCTSLASVTLGNAVADLGDDAFFDCTALAAISLDSSLTNIGAAAFTYCFDLPGLAIPNGVRTIGSQAFWYCSSLTTVNLPASVAGIGDRVFEFCDNLTALTVDPANPAYYSADGVLFEQRSARLLQYPANKPLASYAIPPGTADIADTAFVSAYNLTSVTLPASVTNIETLAFYDCVDVNGFFFEGNSPSLGNNVFTLDNAATVYYLPGTTTWGPTFGGLPTSPWDPRIQPAAAHLNDPANASAFGFSVAGTTNIPVVVEASTNLGAGPWVVLQSTTLTNGVLNFSDPAWTNFPGRFYRIRSP